MWTPHHAAGLVGALLLAPAAGGAAEHGAPGSAVHCVEQVDGPQRLRLRMAAGALPPRALAVAQREVIRIWQRYDVEIVWEMGWADESATRSDPAPPDLWVQFLDLSLPSPTVRGAAAIAWIPFVDGTPLRFIRVSRPAAQALLQAKSWLDHEPLVRATDMVKDEALGLIVGRSIAHEIGHYLLGSGGHARNGLMRAALPPDRLVRPGGRYFRLEEADIRALRTARLTSCVLAARR